MELQWSFNTWDLPACVRGIWIETSIRTRSLSRRWPCELCARFFWWGQWRFVSWTTPLGLAIRRQRVRKMRSSSLACWNERVLQQLVSRAHLANLLAKSPMNSECVTCVNNVPFVSSKTARAKHAKLPVTNSPVVNSNSRKVVAYTWRTFVTLIVVVPGVNVRC